MIQNQSYLMRLAANAGRGGWAQAGGASASASSSASASACRRLWLGLRFGNNKLSQPPARKFVAGAGRAWAQCTRLARLSRSPSGRKFESRPCRRRWCLRAQLGKKAAA